jgi:hypothetical protein
MFQRHEIPRLRLFLKGLSIGQHSGKKKNGLPPARGAQTKKAAFHKRKGKLPRRKTNLYKGLLLTGYP